MPKKRRDKSDGKAKSNHSFVKTIFYRYNKDKITNKGLQQFFISLFYRLGSMAELQAIVVWKGLCKIGCAVKKRVKRVFKEVKIFTGRMLDTIFEDIGQPISRLKDSVKNIRAIIKRSKEDKSVKAGTEIKEYVSQGVKKHKSFVPNLISYIVPLVCFGAMLVVVNIGLNKNYAVEIMVEDQVVGAVDSYNEFKNANKVITNKLITLNDEQKWVIEPKVKVVSIDKSQTTDVRQLADNILKASSQDIVSASGLYVDGKFYGAVKDPTNLKAALANMLSPYQDGDPNKSVSFLQDVAVVDGIFFTDTLAEDNALEQLVTGQIAGEVWYTVAKGDSPSLIAAKNNLRLKELYALNPELEGGGLWIGDKVLVSQAVPFLQVKEVVRKSYEVEIAYKTEQKPNNSMTVGTTKTTQKGEKGINLVTSDFVYIDGIENSETVIDTQVLKEPVTEIVEVGRLIPNVGVLTTGGTGAFGWPTGGGVRVSRGFAGQYPAHNGVDIAGPYGTPIYASDSGVVTKAVYTRTGYGVYLIIEHGNGYQSLYAHCSQLMVSYGQQVTKGQLIALMGSTGNSTGNHLHFEIKSGNTRFDPYRFF